MVHSVLLHLAHYLLSDCEFLMDDVWGMFAFLFDKLSFVSELAPLDKNISMQIIIERDAQRGCRAFEGRNHVVNSPGNGILAQKCQLLGNPSENSLEIS